MKKRGEKDPCVKPTKQTKKKVKGGALGEMAATRNTVKC